MNISHRGMDYLAALEDTKLSPYRDAAGLLTIGTGHLITQLELAANRIAINDIEVDYSLGITSDQATQLLFQDLKPFVAVVNEITTPLNQNQFDALVIFAYNIGVGAFRKCGARRAAQNNQLDAVPAWMMQWNKITVGGVKKVSKGLVNRRNKEVELWEMPV